MKKIGFAAFAMLATGIAIAYPTKQELARARPLVEELMGPVLSEYKNKTKSASDVAQTSVQFSASAKSEAVKYLFLRGAVGYYVKGGDFGAAADTIEHLKSNIKGVPPSDIAEIISGALGRENARRAPRLLSQLQLAQAQVKASKDSRKLASQLKQVKTEPALRQYAEALALAGDWKGALAEFAKVSGEVGRMAKADADGTAGGSALGDFWWNYETSYTGGEPVFRERAANYYRKALADGKIDGLMRTLVEQRLASLKLPDVDNSASSPVSSSTDVPQAADERQKNRSRTQTTAKDPSGLVHRWSFTDGFADAAGNAAPTKYGSAKAEDGVEEASDADSWRIRHPDLRRSPHLLPRPLPRRDHQLPQPWSRHTAGSQWKITGSQGGSQKCRGRDDAVQTTSTQRGSDGASQPCSGRMRKVLQVRVSVAAVSKSERLCAVLPVQVSQLEEPAAVSDEIRRDLLRRTTENWACSPHKKEELSMKPVSHVKPCAGNPHARFDEGASASEKPRWNALLHNKQSSRYYVQGLGWQ